MAVLLLRVMVLVATVAVVRLAVVGVVAIVVVVVLVVMPLAAALPSRGQGFGPNVLRFLLVRMGLVAVG